ncbi:hypothetical protein BHM03_00001424 [Ensete ventricosum]|nr:hypothetical protein BHM03_00001424 [Ensete ventricosum]
MRARNHTPNFPHVDFERQIQFRSRRKLYAVQREEMKSPSPLCGTVTCRPWSGARECGARLPNQNRTRGDPLVRASRHHGIALLTGRRLPHVSVHRGHCLLKWFHRISTTQFPTTATVISAEEDEQKVVRRINREEPESSKEGRVSLLCFPRLSSAVFLLSQMKQS